MAGFLSHLEIEELVVADALDGLDAGEGAFLLEEIARHGPDCEECRTLQQEYGEVAGGLAATLDPVPLSAGAEERLLAAARGGQPAPVTPAAAGRGPAAARRPPAPARWVAALVAAALLAGAGAVGYVLAPKGPARPPAQTAFLRFASAPGTRIASFPAPNGQQLAVAFHAGQTQGWIVGASVPAPPADHVYELWYRLGSTGPMRPAGTFTPIGGTILAKATLGPAFSLLAVSVEPQGGSEQPTTTPVYVTNVTT